MKRHPKVSIRTPEACSAARAMAFHPTNMKKFFDMVGKVLETPMIYEWFKYVKPG